MISELAAKLKDALDQAFPHITKMDEAKTKADAAKALLDSTLKELEDAKASVAKANAELVNIKNQLLAGKVQVDDAHARALIEVQKQITDAQKTLTQLNEQVTKKQILHDEIIASMNSLNKRLNLS